MKVVRLEQMDIQTDVDTGAMRATFTVSTDTGSHELWFEVPEGELVTDGVTPSSWPCSR